MMIGSDVLSAEDWLLFEKINDLFANYKDLNNRFQNALEIILDRMGYSAGAIYLVEENHGLQDIWIRRGVPAALEEQMEDPASPLHLLVSEVVKDGKLRQNLPDLGIAAVFPLVSISGGVLGAFVVCGPAISAGQMKLWQAFFRPLTRLIEIQNAASSQFSLEQFALALLSISEKQSSDDILQLQETALHWLCELLRAEDALLLLRNETDPRVTVGYLLSRCSEWGERRGLVVEENFFDGKYYEPEVILPEHPTNNWLLKWVDPAFSGKKVSRAVCYSLRDNEKVLGTIVLMNSTSGILTRINTEFLKLVGNILTRAILDAREMARIKTSLGDLEANRWEIINSRNTLRRMFDSLPLSVYIIDRSYILRAINANRCERLGVQARDLVGKKCYEQLFRRSDPCPQCRAAESFETGARTRRSAREWDNNEQFTEWEIYTHPVQSMETLPQQMILVEEDVTEKRNLESNLIQSEKLAAVGHLAAGVAHEINNPLATSIANAQILKRELPKDNLDWIDSISLIEMAGGRAAQVVSNLLEIAHKDQQTNFEPTSLNDTIESALSLVHHEITSRSLEVVLDLQEDMPAMMASKNQLQGVWINLLVNCFDAIDKPQGVIRISSVYADRAFRVTIIDNGKGIPQEHLNRIFTPFFTTKTVGKGTGLGLSVSQRAIKEHQGTIQVESIVGQGTKVSVIFQDSPR